MKFQLPSVNLRKLASDNWRPALYSLFKGLAYRFADEKLKARLPVAFQVLDGAVGSAIVQKDPTLVSAGIDLAIKAATGQTTAKDFQVEQLVDLFDPDAFVRSQLRR